MQTSTFADKLTERVNVIYVNQFDWLSSGKTRHLYRLSLSIWVFLKHSERAFNMLKNFVPIYAVLLQFLGCYPGKISADGQLGDVYSDGTKKLKYFLKVPCFKGSRFKKAAWVSVFR